METLRVIRVTTKDKGCYVRDKSSFHVNMNGHREMDYGKEKLFVKMDQFEMPQKVKKMKFIMSFGYDTNFLKEENVKEYEINYVSMNDLCHQVNFLVYNDFILKTACVANPNVNSTEDPIKAPVKAPVEVPTEVPIEAPVEAPVEASVEAPVEASIEAPVKASIEAPDEASVEAPVKIPAESTVEVPVVIKGPSPVIRNDNGNAKIVDASTLFMNYSLRQKMSGKKTTVPVKEMFCLEYVDGRVQMKMADGFMFFASVNLMLSLGFKSEVMRSGKSEAEILSESDNLTMKICRSFSISDIVHFLADKEKICHVGFRKLVDPSFYIDGNLHSILSSYDVEKKVFLCNMKRLNNMSLREVQFTLYNNLFEPYEIGACVKKCPISFNLVICKKL